jgi:hypothetical protein
MGGGDHDYFVKGYVLQGGYALLELIGSLLMG